MELAPWQHGHCPFCGWEPDFAVITPHAERRLICGRCAAQWPYPPLTCPFCVNDDRSLITSFATRDGRYRVYACDVCRRYLKAYDGRHALRPLMISVDTIATLQRFFATHADDFDNVTIFTDTSAISDSFAYELTVSNAIEGLNLETFDMASEWGSADPATWITDGSGGYPTDADGVRRRADELRRIVGDFYAAAASVRDGVIVPIV